MAETSSLELPRCTSTIDLGHVLARCNLRPHYAAGPHHAVVHMEATRADDHPGVTADFRAADVTVTWTVE